MNIEMKKVTKNGPAKERILNTYSRFKAEWVLLYKERVSARIIDYEPIVLFKSLICCSQSRIASSFSSSSAKSVTLKITALVIGSTS